MLVRNILIFYGSQRLEAKFRLAAMFYMSRHL